MFFIYTCSIGYECLSGIVSVFLLAVGRYIRFAARKKSVMRRVPGASRLVDPLRDDRRRTGRAHPNEIFLPVLLVALFFFSLSSFPPRHPPLALMDRNVCRYFRSRAAPIPLDNYIHIYMCAERWVLYARRLLCVWSAHRAREFRKTSTGIRRNSSRH